MKNKHSLLVSIFILFSSSLFAQSVKEVHVHIMEKGDTLWSLSARYFDNPLIWANITEMDGTAVPDVYRIPVGHQVLVRPLKIKPIQKKVINNKIDVAVALTNPLNAEATPRKNPFIKHDNFKESSNQNKTLVRKSVPRMERNQYLYLTKTSGLVRAFWDGEYVTIPVSLVVEHIKNNMPEVKESVLSNGIYIDKKLIKQLLGIKKK